MASTRGLSAGSFAVAAVCPCPDVGGERAAAPFSKRRPNEEGASPRRIRALVLLLAAALAGSTGCAALTNPVADGVPARLVPTELLAASKAGEQTVPLNLLRQPKPTEYRLAPGDVLGGYIESFLGDRAPPPVHFTAQHLPREHRRQPAALGYPILVQPDGTIDLPVAGRLRVTGMTVPEAREAIRDLYDRKKLLKRDSAVILLTLLQPRQYSVLVLRQEGATFGTGPDGFITTSKRGTGYAVDLPAYENDVLHALAQTGGLPGLDACNAIVIYRDCFRDGHERSFLLQNLQGVRGDHDPMKALGLGTKVTRIPLRLPCGQPLPIRPEDILLGNGDVVFLEACDHEVFFTGGLLPPAAHVLPRDHDLDVIEAVSLVRGPLLNGAFGGSNLSGTLIQPGIGNPNPTLLTVVRRTPGGGQVPIKVDLAHALHHPEERILVKAGDLLILQEQPEQALTRYFSQTFLNFNIFWRVFRSDSATGVLDVSAPDRLPGRLGTINFTQLP